MIQITPQMRIRVAVDPVDFRRGIDGMARLCREVLDSDPFAGGLFVFRNRRATAIKILTHDSQGFWLAHKPAPHRGRPDRRPSSAAAVDARRAARRRGSRASATSETDPVLAELIRQAAHAHGEVVHNDDTSMTVLALQRPGAPRGDPDDVSPDNIGPERGRPGQKS